MVNTPFVSKRAPAYADVPEEKWNNWRWQLSNRINTPEEFEKVVLAELWYNKRFHLELELIKDIYGSTEFPKNYGNRLQEKYTVDKMFLLEEVHVELKHNRILIRPMADFILDKRPEKRGFKVQVLVYPMETTLKIGEFVK